MKAKYKKGMKGIYLALEEPGAYREDYQIPMLEANSIPGVLKVKGRGLDDHSCYYYGISGMVSMKKKYSKEKISRNDLQLFLRQLLRTMQEVDRHLLNIGRLLLKPEYIFFADGQFWFCYYPLGEGEAEAQLHALSEYFVRQVDYEDKEAIYIAHQLHKRTMDEHFPIEQVVEAALEVKKVIVNEPQKRAEIPDNSLLQAEIHEEHPEVKNEKRKFAHLPKALKKSRWGNWDEIHFG